MPIDSSFERFGCYATLRLCTCLARWFRYASKMTTQQFLACKQNKHHVLRHIGKRRRLQERDNKISGRSVFSHDELFSNNGDAWTGLERLYKRRECPVRIMPRRECGNNGRHRGGERKRKPLPKEHERPGLCACYSNKALSASPTSPTDKRTVMFCWCQQGLCQEDGRTVSTLVLR